MLQRLLNRMQPGEALEALQDRDRELARGPSIVSMCVPNFESLVQVVWRQGPVVCDENSSPESEILVGTCLAQLGGSERLEAAGIDVVGVMAMLWRPRGCCEVGVVVQARIHAELSREE